MVNGNNSTLGYYVSATVSATSIPSGTEKTLKSITVESGIYIVAVHAYFADATSTVIGMRTLGIKVDGTRISSTINKPYEWGTGAECVQIAIIENETSEIEMYASQSSGNDITISGDITITRLK